MTAVDPRTPVLVGAGQVTHRPGRGEVPPPLELMVQAARSAAGDAGPGGDRLLARAGSVGVVDLFSWPVPDPARALAGELGLSPRETVRTARGGNGPIALLGDLASRVASGALDVALLAGGEAVTPFMRATKAGEPTGWPKQPEGTEPTRLVGTDREPSHPAETAAGLIAPVFWYPMFENALRAGTGRTPEAHQEAIAALWARFAAVAVGNEFAWNRDAPDAAAIGSPSPDNRLVSFPYTKLMNANIQVDQAAALLLCSAEAAEAAGIARDRWVFVHATAAAHDHWFPGERDSLARSPAIAACGRAALGHAGLDIGDVTELDLYSCFPSAVEIAALELGVDLDGGEVEPTVTGGLTFAGGPANNYVTHALATLVGRLRARPESAGLSTAVGWYLTKHGVAVLSGRPPRERFASLGLQDEVDALPKRSIAEGARAVAPIETYTALYDRDGAPTMGVVSALLDDGSRALAMSQERETVDALLDGDALGRRVSLDGAAGFRIAG